MLQKAKERSFAPEYVLILKLMASFGWFFLDEAEKQSFGESRRGRDSAPGGAGSASSGLWVCPSVSDGLK